MKERTLEETIEKLVTNPLNVEMAYKYNNQIELSGWVLRKPKFITHDKKGVTSCSMILFQITNANGEIKVESFSTMVYVKELVDQLQMIDKVIFVATMGKLRHHFKYGEYSQVTEMKTLVETDMPLAKEYKGE